MKNVTEEMLHEIDWNNMKIVEILKGVIALQDGDIDSVDLNVLAEAALDYAEKNSSLFNAIW